MAQGSGDGDGPHSPQAARRPRAPRTVGPRSRRSAWARCSRRLSRTARAHGSRTAPTGLSRGGWPGFPPCGTSCVRPRRSPQPSGGPVGRRAWTRTPVRRSGPFALRRRWKARRSGAGARFRGRGSRGDPVGRAGAKGALVRRAGRLVLTERPRTAAPEEVGQLVPADAAAARGLRCFPGTPSRPGSSPGCGSTPGLRGGPGRAAISRTPVLSPGRHEWLTPHLKLTGGQVITAGGLSAGV